MRRDVQVSLVGTYKCVYVWLINRKHRRLARWSKQFARLVEMFASEIARPVRLNSAGRYSTINKVGLATRCQRWHLHVGPGARDLRRSSKFDYVTRNRLRARMNAPPTVASGQGRQGVYICISVCLAGWLALLMAIHFSHRPDQRRSTTT